MKKLKYLVTGTGRSGTVYMSRFLTSVGIMCGHESIFTPQGINEASMRLTHVNNIKTSKVSLIENDNWFDHNLQIAESSYMSCPFLQHDILKDTKIIHVIRNPLKVISSTFIDAKFLDDNNKGQKRYSDFVYQFLPNLKNIVNRLERVTCYYILWNEMVKKNSINKNYYLHKIEDGINKNIFDFLEIEPKNNFYDNKKSNCWYKREKDLNIDDLPSIDLEYKIYNIMKTYEYKIKKKYI